MNRGGEGEKDNDTGLYDLSVDDMYEDIILLYSQRIFYSTILVFLCLLSALILCSFYTQK